MTPYQQGFEQGYQSIKDHQQIGMIWADIFAQAEAHGEPLLSPAQESDWWLGYYQGRYYARTGKLPAGLIRRAEQN